MKTVKSIENLVEVPEQIVKLAAAAIPLDEPSGLRTVLKAAEEYKAADLTPIFILDQDTMEILVVCAETFGKRLN